MHRRETPLLCHGTDRLWADVPRVYWYQGRIRKWRHWELIKERMGRINSNYTNWVGIPWPSNVETKWLVSFHLQWRCHPIVPLLGIMPQTIIENWLYTWIPKWKGKLPGTWILKWTQKYSDVMARNNAPANCVLWSKLSTRAKVLVQEETSGVTDLAGVNQEGLLTVDFTCFLCKWRRRLGMQMAVNSRCWDLFPPSVASGFPFPISIRLKSPGLPAIDCLKGNHILRFLCSSLGW